MATWFTRTGLTGSQRAQRLTLDFMDTVPELGTDWGKQWLTFYTIRAA